jgi:hypothetical protein
MKYEDMNIVLRTEERKRERERERERSIYLLIYGRLPLYGMSPDIPNIPLIGSYAFLSSIVILAKQAVFFLISNAL